MGTFVAELVEFFKRYHARTYGWDGAPIHDAVALAHVLRPGIVTTGHYNVEIETGSELTRGRTVVDRWHRTDREPNAHVGVEIEADAFFELLLERVASFDEAASPGTHYVAVAAVGALALGVGAVATIDGNLWGIPLALGGAVLLYWSVKVTRKV